LFAFSGAAIKPGRRKRDLPPGIWINPLRQAIKAA